jgi:hypothetical protein
MKRHTHSTSGDSGPLTIIRHPPEHGPGGTPDVLPAGCCCCCCCCLHTLGGLIGAVVGSVNPIQAAPVRMSDPDSPFPFRRDEFEDEGPVMPATALYWLLVVFLIAVTAVWYYVDRGARNPEDILFGLLIALMIFPALQLGASLLSLIAVALFYPSRSMPLKRVGKITLWSFVGTIAGIVFMAGCCGILSMSNKRW